MRATFPRHVGPGESAATAVHRYAGVRAGWPACLFNASVFQSIYTA